MEYLVGSNILRRSQLNGSYDGSPALFVQSDGKAALQGFATSEPYLYEHEIKQWGTPLRFQLVNDTGYPVHFAATSIRTGDKAKLSPCLAKLVPICSGPRSTSSGTPSPRSTSSSTSSTSTRQDGSTPGVSPSTRPRQ